MSGLAQRDFRRILMIKPSSPGDIIHALPVLHALRSRYPSAHIAWLVASGFADLIACDPALDEVIQFDRRRFGRIGRSLSVTRDFIQFLRRLRAQRFDLVIDLQGLFRSGFLAWCTGAKSRIGPVRAREMSWFFYTDRIPLDARSQHAADANYNLARVLGFEETPMDFTICVSQDDREKARALLREAGITSKPCIVLVPGTRWQTKCWPAERFGQLAARLQHQTGLKSVLVGGPDDCAAGDAAVAASLGAATNLCGRTSLRQLAALIHRAALVVTADSMPMHMAAALDRPLVALFGPTNPSRTGPYGRKADVLQLHLDCSPCYLRRLAQCQHQHACMQGLDVEQVASAALLQLRSYTAAEVRP
jgi:lipopolysaccharide heptosyltransferase I